MHRIVYRDGKYCIEDLGSANGTQVNGQRIAGERALVNGDEIMFGTQVKIHFTQIQAAPKPVDEHAPTKHHALPDVAPGATMFDQGVDLSMILKSAPTNPPKLLLTVAGNEQEEHVLSKHRSIRKK